MATKSCDLPNAFGNQLHGSSLPQRLGDTDLRLREPMQKATLRPSLGHTVIPVAEALFSNPHGFGSAIQGVYQQGHWHSSMSAEEPAVLTADPMVDILAAFYAIPNEYQADLFNDFKVAADSQDLRSLLDTISDWAATAELYAHPALAADLQDAIGGRRGVADWLPG